MILIDVERDILNIRRSQATMKKFATSCSVVLCLVDVKGHLLSQLLAYTRRSLRFILRVVMGDHRRIPFYQSMTVQ